MPMVVGASWSLVAFWLASNQQRAGLAQWSVVALQIAGAGGLPVFMIGVCAALTRVSVHIDRVTGRCVWSKRWVFVPFAERGRVEFSFGQVRAVRLKREAGASRSGGGGRGAEDRSWRVQLWLRGPARLIELGLFTDEAVGEAFAGELAELLGVGTARRLSREAPGPGVQHPLLGVQQRLLEQKLEPGETLLWCARARAGANAARMGAWPTMLFGFVWLGLVVGACSGPVFAMGSSLAGVGAGAAAGIVLGAFFGWPGLLMAAGPVWAWWLGLRTAFALTDRRLIVLEGGLWGAPRLRQWGPSVPGSMRVEQRPDGSGHLVIGDDDGLFGLEAPVEVEALVRATLGRG